MSTSHLRAPLVVSVVLAALGSGLAACTAGETGPAAPHPSGKAAAVCRALHERLPDRVYGQRRVSLDPDSTYTAAWGDPGIELRCGVPRPEKLTPGSEHYNPTATAAEVNGVSWALEKRQDDYRFTTTGRTAYVEVTVPHSYGQETGALTDLAKAVRASDPRR